MWWCAFCNAAWLTLAWWPQNYVTSLLPGKLGGHSLAILYGVGGLSCLAAPVVVDRLGTTTTMFIGALSYPVYLGSMIYVESAVVLAASVVIGAWWRVGLSLAVQAFIDPLTACGMCMHRVRNGNAVGVLRWCVWRWKCVLNALTVGACGLHAVYISRLSEGSGDQGGYVGSFWSILQARTWGHGLGLMCGRGM